MNFEEFVTVIVDRLVDYYGDDAEISVKEVTKNNDCQKHGLQIMKVGDFITPMIYLDELYNQYKASNKDIDEVIEHIIDIRNQVPDPSFKRVINELSSLEKNIDRIYPMLINKSQNSDVLSDLVFREFLDLAIIYYIRIDTDDENGQGTVKISRALMENMQTTEEELYEIALSNLGNDGYEKKSILSTIREMRGYEFDEEILDLEEADCNMYVLANRTKLYGAAAMLDEELIADMDGYLVPSSVHELLYVPRKHNDISVEDLNKMVIEVNSTQVAEEEVLSNHVYSISDGKIEMCVA